MLVLNAEKLKEKIAKEAKEQGLEPKYFFFAFEENGELKFSSSIIGKGELHAIIGMLERAKHDFIKMIDRQ